MKQRNLIIGMLFTGVLLLVVSCSESGNDTQDSIEGTYYGTITRSSSLKSAQPDFDGLANGTAEVTMTGDNQIEVHCFGSELDTTFILDYYMHNDSVLVCLTGDDFENMYGHMLGVGHMGGNMMGDIGNNETEWMHHLSDEHHQDDEHFGGFDLHMGTFTYSLRMTNEAEPYYMIFAGSKEL